MAKRSSTARIVRIGAPRAPSPIIRIAAPRPAKAKRRRARRSGGGGIVSGHNIQMAIGGALYGFAVKSGYVQKLPPIPLLGRTGTAALLLDYWGKHGGGDMVRRAATAAAVLAGYQLGSEGSITGDMQTTGNDSYADGDDDE